MQPNHNSQRVQNSSSNVSSQKVKCFTQQHSIAVEYLLSMIDDINQKLPPSVYGAADSAMDKRELLRRFQSEGLTFATQTLPKLSAGLLLYLETGQVCYPSFAIKKGTNHPVFLQSLFRLACRDGEYQVEALRCIYQISVAFKKLKGPYPVSVLSKQLADFVKVDSELESIDLFDDVNLPILERARSLVRILFKGFSLDSVHVTPRPGPGATNTPVAKHMRYRPYVLYTQIDKVLPYVDFFSVHPYDPVQQAKVFLDCFKNQVKEQRARFKFVHKQVGKARGICIEQNETQYLQQALKNALYNWLQKHPLVKGRINFDDQSINASLALGASVDRLLSTIDMSEASDRVMRHLVSWLFQDTVLHDALMALSTKWIDLPKDLVGDRAIKTVKYAPMGSGLCFPIMSVVHWALICAMIELSQYPDSYKKKVYVYGDDIIMPAEATEMVYTYLPRFGMKVNATKSYYKSHFRESCGVHAFKGHDITPVFFKHLPVTSHLKTTMSCLAVEADLYYKGFCCTAALLRRGLLEFYDLGEVPWDSSVLGFKRRGVLLPEKGKVLRKVDSWGNPMMHVRTVSEIDDKSPPPTEHELYLRYVLTKDIRKEVGGNSAKHELRWKSVAIPGLYAIKPSKFLDYFTKTFDKQDVRNERDIQQEALSESKPAERFSSKFRTIPAQRYVRFISTHYPVHARSKLCSFDCTCFGFRRRVSRTCAGRMLRVL